MNNYYDKYIKYKSKYLLLKGGMNSDNEEKLQKLINAFKKNFKSLKENLNQIIFRVTDLSGEEFDIPCKPDTTIIRLHESIKNKFNLDKPERVSLYYKNEEGDTAKLEIYDENGQQKKVSDYAFEVIEGIVELSFISEENIPIPRQIFRELIDTYLSDDSADKQEIIEIYGEISNWNTSEITDMSNLFSNTENVTEFNEDISEWNTSAVTNMSYMFKDCSEFNKPLNWDTRNVTDMSYMFYECFKFDKPLNFDTGNVTTMEGMFYGCYEFDKPLNFTNTRNVTNMAHMFVDAEIFDKPLNKLDTSNVTTMQEMFLRARKFDQSLDHFETNNVTTMKSMFLSAQKFNQPLNHFETSNVTDMSGMFYAAESFNQNLNNWDTNNVQSMMQMFKRTPMNNMGNLPTWYQEAENN